jgi:DNA-binding MarR family transcriptional regulator
MTTSPQIATIVRRASQNIERLATARIQHLGLTYRQMMVLLVVKEKEGCSQRHIYRVTGIDRTTVSHIARTLEQKGLVVHTVNPEDARSVRITMTPEGERVAAAGKRIMQKVEAELGRVIKGKEAIIDDALTKLGEI